MYKNNVADKEFLQHTQCCWSQCTTSDVGGGLAGQAVLHDQYSLSANHAFSENAL